MTSYRIFETSERTWLEPKQTEETAELCKIFEDYEKSDFLQDDVRWLPAWAGVTAAVAFSTWYAAHRLLGPRYGRSKAFLASFATAGFQFLGHCAYQYSRERAKKEAEQKIQQYVQKHGMRDFTPIIRPMNATSICRFSICLPKKQ